MRQSIFFFGTLVLLCGMAVASMVFDANPMAVESVTTFEDVRPIFSNRCSKCHKAAQDWTNYEIAYRNRYNIKNRVSVFKNMPPLGQPMTQEERDLIRKWVNEGAKE